jgi:ribosomal-protein-alanine N-acetyltransferase
MSDKPVLRTRRLLLRPWKPEDLPAYAAINADPEVRRWFPGTLTREESDAQAARLQQHIALHGFGCWAVEVSGIAPFIGFVGLQHVTFASRFTPTIGAGWRLARDHWGKGYATEAAQAALAHGFRALGFDEIVAFAVHGNVASTRVMQRIGMHRDPADDFDHPELAENDPHRRHVLYRAKRSGMHGLGWKAHPRENVR